jgi:hypothetical protein
MKYIYFVKNKDGKYLNYKDGKNPYFVDSLISATPSDKPQQLNGELELEQITMDDFKQIYSMTVSELIIIGELFHRKAKIYQDTIPVLPKLNKDVRNSVRNAISKMSLFHTQADEIIDHGQEDEIYSVSGEFEELIINVSEAIKGDMKKYNQVFRAMKVNENAILGIAKKYDNQK